MTAQTPTASTFTAADADAQSPQRTITTPATAQETQDAIDALLLLGTIGMHANPTANPEDNEMLMPIGGDNMAVTVASPHNDDVTPTDETIEIPKVGTVLGVAVKSDITDETEAPEPDVQEPTTDTPDSENKDKKNTNGGDPNSKNKSSKKKMFVTRQFGLKRRGKPQRKFKCSVCAKELDTVQEYNQHYLDNQHPNTMPILSALILIPTNNGKTQIQPC